MRFTKLHGLGNDFVVIGDADKSAPEMTAEKARKLGDRRHGVGADQILVVSQARSGTNAKARMQVWNADGSTSEMCGNGIRAVALYLKAQGLTPIDTDAGVLEVATIEISSDGKRGTFAVDMGVPVLDPSNRPETLIEVPGLPPYRLIRVGNPHAAFVLPSGRRVADIPLEAVGPRVEKSARFAQLGGVNVEFIEIVAAQVASQARLNVRVWERGAGATLACGTGACAAVAAARLHDPKLPERLTVALPGGELQIEWTGAGRSILMTGPAERVFDGDWTLF